MVTLTDEQMTAAFEAWEAEYRANPDGFMTPEETRAMETATLAERCTITFKAYLRQVQTA